MSLNYVSDVTDSSALPFLAVKTCSRPPSIKTWYCCTSINIYLQSCSVTSYAVSIHYYNTVTNNRTQPHHHNFHYVKYGYLFQLLSAMTSSRLYFVKEVFGRKWWSRPWTWVEVSHCAYHAAIPTSMTMNRIVYVVNM